MNERLKKQIDSAIKRIEGRKQSEKILVLAMLVAGIVLGYLSIAIDPLSIDMERIEAQMRIVEQQIEGQRSAYESKLVTSQEDPSRFANDRLQALSRELEILDSEITSLAGDLISPAEMTQILTSVLGRYSGLELVSFQNKRAAPLRSDFTSSTNVSDSGSDALNISGADINGQVFEHGLILEFQGDFFNTLKYLRFLEEISGSFFWDSITFRQLAWPNAAVTLEIHTLSTDEGFIGV